MANWYNNCWANIPTSTDRCCNGTGCFVTYPNSYVVGQPVGDGQSFEVQFSAINASPYWYLTENGAVIGVYPTSVYHGTMQRYAPYFQVGGEVYDSWFHERHTATYMGSGFSAGGFPYEAYHRAIEYEDLNGNVLDASLSYIFGTGICGWQASNYYALQAGTFDGAPGFFFGGGM